MTRVLTEEELAARNSLQERMKKEQELRSQHAPKVSEKSIDELDVERCDHGVPLRKSCPKCDVVSDDQIKRTPLGRV